MIDGKKITLGGREFTVPPAPFVAMRKYKPVFSGEQAPDFEMMGDIVYMALKRNYPELDQAEFEAQCLDVANMRAAFDAVMNTSGMEAREPGEAQPGNP